MPIRPRSTSVEVGRYGRRIVHVLSVRDLAELSKLGEVSADEVANSVLQRVVEPALRNDEIAGLPDADIAEAGRVVRQSSFGSKSRKSPRETHRQALSRAYNEWSEAFQATMNEIAAPAIAAAADFSAMVDLSAMREAAAQVASALAVYDSIKSTVQNIVDATSAALRYFEPAWEAVRLLAERRRVYLVLAENYWLISPRVAGSELDEVLGRFDGGDLPALERQLMAYFDPAACRKLLEPCFRHPGFEPWRVVLNKALSAHERGDHELAIPIWMMAIDGIWKQQVIKEPYAYKERPSEREIAKIEEALAQDSLAGSFLVEAFLVTMRQMGGDPGPVDLSQALKRNGVLHGMNPAVGTVKQSVQLVLALELLHYCLEHRAREAPEGTGANTEL